MVIHQFNKLIRNKWVWGVFAVIVSAAFCCEDLFTSRQREERGEGSAGILAGKSVSASLFRTVAEDLRGLGRNRDWKRSSSEINRSAWETLAALKVAEENGLLATDEEIKAQIRNDPSFQVNGQFSFEAYDRLLRENGMLPEHLEEYIRRRLTLQRVNDEVLGAAAWVSPTEINRALADMTDTYTVRVASFKQDKAAADAITIDDDGVKKWYDENSKTLALPELTKIRFVRFDASKPELLAKMAVTDDELHDYYDGNVDKYTSTDTNGVEVVKTFDEVKGEIDGICRRIAAVDCLETNLNSRAYSVRAAAGSSRLDEIAKEDGLNVQTSEWFALEGGSHPGFSRPASTICPGAQNFLEAVAELDVESEDLRYGIVRSEAAVWLIEKVEVRAAHIPTFEEAKEVIRPRALEAAKADAFKKQVEEISAKGLEAVLATENVSTNYTFSVMNLGEVNFPDKYSVATAARKLAKGEISEFVSTGHGTGVLVICDDRQPGDAAKIDETRDRVRKQSEMLVRAQLSEEWMKRNLARLGYETTAETAIEDETTEEE